ncbi:helix-turn-helix domain-containing protein [filamentous cyanobacterium LEGE 07170]|nr:helix-turn-helix domain-containing protein [filamentous cyanobacterium LEGE 07170]
MRISHLSLKALGDSLGVTPSMMSKILSRDTTSARVERAIADAIGKPLWEVFPDRYGKPEPMDEVA